MKTSWHENNFCLTDRFWGESASDRWIPHTKGPYKLGGSGYVSGYSPKGTVIVGRSHCYTRNTSTKTLSHNGCENSWYRLNPMCPIYSKSQFIWDDIKARASSMMTSSNGNIFRVTGHLCGEFTCPRWIPRTKASNAELWCFLWSASE